MTRLTEKQRELATQMWPVALQWASRHAIPEPDIIATDAATTAAASYDPDFGPRVNWLPYLWTQVQRRVWSALKAEAKRCVREKRDVSANPDLTVTYDTPVLEIQDEVAWHLGHAHPAERAAMQRYLAEGQLSRHDPARCGIARYRGRLRRDIRRDER